MGVGWQLTIMYCIVGALFVLIGRELAKVGGSDIRSISYFAALSGTLTFVGLAVASGVGAIDQAGVYQGQAGDVLKRGLDLLLNLSSDLKIVGALALIVLGPQLFSYLVSGLFGCARAPLLVGVTLRVWFWFSVKPFVTVGGALVGASIYGAMHHWKGTSGVKWAVMTWIGFAAILAAEAGVYQYRVFTAEVPPPGLLSWLSGIDKWFRRRERVLTS